MRVHAKFRDLLSGGDRRSIADSQRVRAWALDSLATVSKRKAKLLRPEARCPRSRGEILHLVRPFREEGVCGASCSYPASPLCWPPALVRVRRERSSSVPTLTSGKPKQAEDPAPPPHWGFRLDTSLMKESAGSGFPGRHPVVSHDRNRGPAPVSSHSHRREAGSSIARWRIESWSTCAKSTRARPGSSFGRGYTMPKPRACCARRRHEKSRTRRDRAHGGLRTQTSTAVLCSRSGIGRADPRATNVDAPAVLPRRIVWRRLHRRPERRLPDPLRDALRQGSSAAPARRLSRALES